MLEHQGADLVEALAGVGIAHHEEAALVGEVEHAATGAEHALAVVEVDVNEAAGTLIGEQQVNELDGGEVGVGGCGDAPAQAHLLALKANHLHLHRLGDGCFLRYLQALQVGVGLQVAEVFGDHINHEVGVEVAREADGDIVGHVPLFVVVAHVGDRRIFQVFLGAEDGLRAVWMVGE